MKQLRHALCGIFICLCFVGVSTLKVEQASSSVKVEQASTLVHAEAIDRPPHAALQLISLSLDKWGSKAFRSHAVQPLSANSSRESTLTWYDLVLSSLSNDLATSRILSHDLATSTSLRKSGSHLSGNASSILLTGLSLWVVVAICLLVSPMGPLNGSSGSQRQQEPAVETFQHMSSPMSQASDGSFASRYLKSKGQEKEALSLLLRCNIISQDEFASNCVSEEHIDECVWIAMQMLQQKTLEEWVELSHDGRQSFEDTVAAIYEARENARAHASAMDQPEIQVGQRLPPSADSLGKGGSSVSLGSSVSFGGVEEKVTVPSASVHLSKPAALPKKSPVPVLNCYEQADVDQMSFSSHDGEASSKGGEEEDEGGFPSVFSSSSGFPQSSRSTPTPGATPAESCKSPVDSPSPKRRLRLASQEIMARPPMGVPPSASSHSPIDYSAAQSGLQAAREARPGWQASIEVVPGSMEGRPGLPALMR